MLISQRFHAPRPLACANFSVAKTLADTRRLYYVSSHESEQSLTSFAPLLQRRTIVIMLICAAFGAAASIVSGQLKKPRYIANLVLRVGEVGYVTNAGLVQRSVERPKELVERLRYEHRLKGIGRRAMTMPYLHRCFCRERTTTSSCSKRMARRRQRRPTFSAS